MHSKNKAGAIAEEHVMIWCMERGYYPFRAIMPVGPIDIIAINDCGDTLLLDVKCLNRRVTPGARTECPQNQNAHQKALGVQLIYVDLEQETSTLSNTRTDDLNYIADFLEAAATLPKNTTSTSHTTASKLIRAPFSASTARSSTMSPTPNFGNASTTFVTPEM